MTTKTARLMERVSRLDALYLAWDAALDCFRDDPGADAWFAAERARIAYERYRAEPFDPDAPDPGDRAALRRVVAGERDALPERTG